MEFWEWFKFSNLDKLGPSIMQSSDFTLRTLVFFVAKKILLFAPAKLRAVSSYTFILYIPLRWH